MLHEGLYVNHGPPTEDADIAAQSLSNPVQFVLDAGLTEKTMAAEQSNIDGLTKAGFNLDFGQDDSGIYHKDMTWGGGHHIDVRCYQLIIDDKVKVEQSPGGTKGFTPQSLVLADRRELEAGIVVLATRYDNMRATSRKALGDKVADRCKDVWALDGAGEVKAMWRPSGHPRLWFLAGALALCRVYCRFLALQIMASEKSL